MVSDPDIRASDAERERVATQLREYAAEGRLDVDELSERLQQAYAARTRGDLERITSDLPAPAPLAPTPPATPERHRSWGVPQRLGTYAGVMALLVVIWAVSGGGSFWPIWPAIGLAFAILTGRDRHFGRHGRHRLR